MAVLSGETELPPPGRASASITAVSTGVTVTSPPSAGIQPICPLFHRR